MSTFPPNKTIACFCNADVVMMAHIILTVAIAIGVGIQLDSLLMGIFALCGYGVVLLDDDAKYEISLWRAGLILAAGVIGVFFWGMPALQAVVIGTFIWAACRMLFSGEGTGI